MSTLNSVLECVVNTADVINVTVSNDEAEAILMSYDIEVIGTHDNYDLMLLCGKDRKTEDPFKCETIVVDGYRDKSNRLPPSIVGQFKSKGYNEFDFDNANLMVFTKNEKVAQALARRPFKFEKKEEYKKVEPKDSSFNHKYVAPTNYTHKYTPPSLQEDGQGDLNEK